MDTSANKLEPGNTVAKRYRVLRQLGEGGMGSVYLVQDLKTDERFALKMLHQAVVNSAGTLERFRREARTPARIDSDHVARVTDTDVATELNGVPFLVMEYLRGSNLQAVSDELGPLPAEEVMVYLRQAAIALDKAHGIGIVHRDLKPENLFLTTRDDGTPCLKVLDFGIAKLSGAAGDLATYKATHTGEIFGTPLFMSPEQCKGELERIGPQTDLWALGLIAFRLLSGKDFWTAATLTHLIAQIAYEPIPLASTRGLALGEAFDAWFAKCCAREPGDRFASAGEAVRELGRALGVPEPARSQDYLRVSNLRAAAMVRVDTDQDALPLKSTAQALTLSHVATRQSRRRRVGLWLMAALLTAGGAAVVLALSAQSGSSSTALAEGDAPGAGTRGPLHSAPSPNAGAPASAPAASAPASSVSTTNASASANTSSVSSAAPSESARASGSGPVGSAPATIVSTAATVPATATTTAPRTSTVKTATTATVTSDPLGSRH